MRWTLWQWLFGLRDTFAGSLKYGMSLSWVSNLNSAERARDDRIRRARDGNGR